MFFNRWEPKLSSEPKTRPPLLPCPALADPGPTGGIDLSDLRSVLLEVTSERARLRRNRALFQKESERFEAVLDPLPSWLEKMYNLSPSRRCSIALYWAKSFRLTEDRTEGDRLWLETSDTGREWLASHVEEQFAFIFKSLREGSRPYDQTALQMSLRDDGWFLGASISVISIKDGDRSQVSYFYPFVSSVEQLQPLRDKLYACFQKLPLGVFHRLDNFAAHVCYGLDNPILLGHQSDEVCVRINGRLVHPREQSRYDTGRWLLGQFVSNRLVSMGCLQAGVDADGELTIARLPRLDVYFGRDLPVEASASVLGETQVVVQPDFSVVVIGVDRSPLAELLPFCEREPSRTGASVLRITRSSVVRASIAGLTGDEILNRLQRISRVPLPGNVVHEVREWSGWLRAVSSEPALLIRCPDAVAADRVVAALGRKALKLNETTVAFSSPTLDESERRKLIEQGVYLCRQD